MFVSNKKQIRALERLIDLCYSIDQCRAIFFDCTHEELQEIKKEISLTIYKDERGLTPHKIMKKRIAELCDTQIQYVKKEMKNGTN